MQRLCRLALILSLTGILAACQLSGPGKGPSGTDVTANAVTGGEIEVTPLDALPGASPATETQPPAAEDETAAPSAAPQATTPASEVPADPEVPAADATPAPQADLEEVPETPKSERQLACEKKRGTWAKIGKGDLRACVFSTKDSGKSCDRESDCEGVCLARSRTCSPAKPLFGCNEILQDNGARVTLCIE